MLYSETLDIPIMEKENINIYQQQSYVQPDECHVTENICNEPNLKTTNVEENQNPLCVISKNKQITCEERLTKFGKTHR